MFLRCLQLCPQLSNFVPTYLCIVLMIVFQNMSLKTIEKLLFCTQKFNSREIRKIFLSESQTNFYENFFP